MLKSYSINIPDELTLFKSWVASINWTLGGNSLTGDEIEMFATLLYFNNKYRDIKDMEVRYELLFSSSTKKKIKELLGIAPNKIETYFTKLRRKGIIVDNTLIDRFIIYPDGEINLTFNLKVIGEIQNRTPYVQPVHQQEVVTSQDNKYFNTTPKVENPVDKKDTYGTQNVTIRPSINNPFKEAEEVIEFTDDLMVDGVETFDANEIRNKFGDMPKLY